MPSTGTILGIDLRVTSVKVVEIERGKERTVLKSWGLTEVPYSLVDKHPQKEDAQAQALRKLLQTRKIKTREASVVVGGGDVYIPFPVEEALIDFYPLPKREPLAETRDYVAACINLKTFREIEYIIRRAGLRLVSISVMSDSLEKAFQSRVMEEKNKIVSLIYMGKRTTNISIFKDGNLEFNRELNIGGENITLAMSGVLVSAEGRVEISPDEAEKIKVEHGIPVEVEKYPKLEEIPISQLQAMVRPALERVQDEIMRTFEYYKGQTGEAAIHKIYLTGGSAMTINLVDFLSEGLGTPVLVPDVMEGRIYSEKLPDKAALEKVVMRLSAAIGAALLAGEKVNLMPEEVKHHFKVLVQKYSKPQYLVPAFVVALLLFYGVFWYQAYSLNQELKSIQKKLEQYKPRIASLNVLEKAAIAEEKKRLEFMAGREKGTKMPLVFEEISRLIPRSVFINSLNLTPSELHMWGTAFEIGDTAENILSRFVLALSASEFFGDVELVQAVKNYEYLQDAFNFEIVAKMTI